MLLKVLILLLMNECNGILHSFPIEYIGKTFSVAEYKNLSICESWICMKDSKRMIAHASLKNDTDPCVDFKEYACGHFYEFRVNNDRYLNIGFTNENKRQYQHRLKRILRKKIDNDEPKIFKIMKSYFQKCVNSDFVRKEGRAEIFALLAEFGKFPLLEVYWNPLDFNLTKAISAFDGIFATTSTLTKDFFTIPTVRDMLHFDLGLSNDVTSDILKGFKHNNHRFKNEIITYWNEQVKALNKSEEIFLRNSQDNFQILDLEIRRKLANYFMISFIMLKIKFFSVYPKTQHTLRALNRYETCIELIDVTMSYPLDVMFQLNHESKFDKVGFKDFIQKVLLIHFKHVKDSLSESHGQLIEHYKDLMMNATIQVGFPDELTSKEFLNKLYGNLNLTGEEGPYKMDQEMKKYKEQLDQYIFIYLGKLSENGKEIYKECGFYHRNYAVFSTCETKNSIVFRINEIMYPIYHPERQYFVNLAYSHYGLRQFVKEYLKKKIGPLYLFDKDYYQKKNILSYDIERQSNYLKYLEMFGLEQNLPGFLMTNQQMIEFIYYQTKCTKFQKHGITFLTNPSKEIFNCPSEEEKKDDDDEYDFLN